MAAQELTRSREEVGEEPFAVKLASLQILRDGWAVQFVAG